jgi:hypothetical protein
MKAMMLTAVEAVRAYEMALARLGRMTLVAPYLVECDGIPVTFDVDETGYVTTVRSCAPHLARSFTRLDADRLASAVRNGDGTPGNVVHVRDAVYKALDAERAVVETLASFASLSELEETM